MTSTLTQEEKTTALHELIRQAAAAGAAALPGMMAAGELTSAPLIDCPTFGEIADSFLKYRDDLLDGLLEVRLATV